MQHRGISTDLITESAISIVNQEGLSELSMPKIARSLGIKSQSLYNHVKNLGDVKTGMSIALFKMLKPRLLEGVLGLTGREAIETYFSIFYEFCLEYNNFSEILFLPGQESSDELDQSFREIIQILHTLLSGVTTDSEEIQLDTRALMSMFVGFVLNDKNHFFQDKSKQGKVALNELIALIFKTIE